MDKHIANIRPQIKQDFNGAVDRRLEPREEPVYELYFREISAGNDTDDSAFKKHHDKN